MVVVSVAKLPILWEWLRSVADACSDEDVEVVVVRDASLPGAEHFGLEFPAIRFVTRAGAAGTLRREGLAMAGGDVVLLTHDTDEEASARLHALLRSQRDQVGGSPSVHSAGDAGDEGACLGAGSGRSDTRVPT
jgi:Glycosyl transferase family 2